MAQQVAFSVDLEPNMDDTMNGIHDAMAWFDRTVPYGTVFATYRIADEVPDLISDLAASHEIGVHIHPREFGHDHDQLAELSIDRQRELITRTRAALADITGSKPISFRAGRHSVSRETLAILADLGFDVDASINIRYNNYLPDHLTTQSKPFTYEGLTEVPVTYGTLPLSSMCGIRALAERPITATAASLRADRWGCSGLLAVEHVLDTATIGSFYMHPYDATDHHDLENCGETYRRRAQKLIDRLHDTTFITIGDIGEP